MKSDRMRSPGSRREFESNLYRLREAFLQGAIAIPPDHRVTDGLLELRTLPNGRIDLPCIDESARSMANTFSYSFEESRQ